MQASDVESVIALLVIATNRSGSGPIASSKPILVVTSIPGPQLIANMDMTQGMVPITRHKVKNLSNLTINSSQVGSSFKDILLCNDIQPGDEPSYTVCKLLYEYHPIGKKMVDVPIEMPQSQERIINIQKGPEEKVRDAFIEEWRKISADDYIANTMRLARIYGVSAIVIKVKGKKDDTALDFESLYDSEISFSVFDPLNIAGSVVLNQQPNDFDFLKTTGIVVQGQPSCLAMRRFLPTMEG